MLALFVKARGFGSDVNSAGGHIGNESRSASSPLQVLALPFEQMPPEFKLKSENTILIMLLAIILIFLWALGTATSTTMGGIIHILLVAAILIVIIKEIRDREAN